MSRRLSIKFSIYLKNINEDIMHLGPLLPQTELENLLEDCLPSVLCLSYVSSRPCWPDLIKAARFGVDICLGGAGVVAEEKPKDAPDNIYLMNMSGEDASSFIQILNSK